MNCGLNYRRPCASDNSDQGYLIELFALFVLYNIVSYSSALENLNAIFSTLVGTLHKPRIGLIVGIIVGLVVIIFLAGLLFFWCKNRRKGYKREVFVDVAGMCSVIVHASSLSKRQH